MKKISIAIIAVFSFCCCKNKVNEPTTISIMSFNIRYDEPNDGQNNWMFRRMACVDMINDQQPDIFGIQEGLAHQVSYLDSSLTRHRFVGEGRDSMQIHNEFSAVFFLTEKFDLLRSGTFWLSETPEVPSKGWDGKYNRIATWVHLKNKHDNKELIAINTHFDHKGTQARIESAKLIVKKASKLSGDTLMTFVIGDFNTLPNDELLTPLNKYLKNSQKQAQLSDSLGTSNGFKVTQEGAIIDYIFYRHATAKQYKTIIKDYGVPYISDHYPIISTFEY